MKNMTYYTMLILVMLTGCTKKEIDANPVWTSHRQMICEEVLAKVKLAVVMGKGIGESKREMIKNMTANIEHGHPAVVVLTSLVTNAYDMKEDDETIVSNCSNALLGFDSDGSKSKVWLASKGIQ